MKSTPLAPTTLLAALGATGVASAQIHDSAPHLTRTTNILLIVADDLGTDMVGAYQEGTDVPPTPAIDSLAADGLLFRNAWSNPAGSCSMATIETGRYSQRTGIGYTIYEGDPALPLSELILPEMLDAGTDGTWSHAMIGEWFLGNSSVGGDLSPNLAGYGHFEGVIGNLHIMGLGYYSYPLVTNGVAVPSTVYATTQQVDSALSFIAGATQPWLCHLAFNAPHTPIHTPPDRLFTVDVPPALRHHGDPRPFFKAMVEAMDTEIGRLLDSLPADVRENTTVIFLADNGTPPESVVPPFVPEHGKNTVYEGGVNVPLIVSGPLVAHPGREETALVNTVDLFATVADIAGVDLATALPAGHEIDSVSLFPYLVDPSTPDRRDYVFTELFLPNGSDPPTQVANYAVRGERYKLMRFGLPGNEKYRFYDLSLDPFEERNLMKKPQLTPDELAVFHELRGQLFGFLALPLSQ